MTEQTQPFTKLIVSGLWAKTFEDGTKILSGSNGGLRWTVRANRKHVEGDTQPTHYLFVDQRPKPEDQAANSPKKEDMPF